MLRRMGTDAYQDPGDLRLFHTGAHSCGYWPERTARDLVLDPRDPRLPHWYPMALGWGFRRSGDILYRPHCAGCRACVAARIPVRRFRPSRSQRRCLARNASVQLRVQPATRTDEQLALYQRYLRARHRDGGMDTHGSAEFAQFLPGSWNAGRFLELREDGRLLAGAVSDVVECALSAVYTLCEPGMAERGLGPLAILRQLEWARQQGHRPLHLGYWIAGHPKMEYKRRFRPLEIHDGRAWRDLEPGDTA